MGTKILIFLLCLLLMACHKSKYEIDAAEFKVLKEPVTRITDKVIQLAPSLKLKDFVSKYDKIDTVPDYFGGLKPRYPMALASVIGFTKLHESALKYDGGMIPVQINLLVLKDSRIIELDSKKAVDSLFVPIDDRKEALSYIALLTDSYPMYDFSFLNHKIKISWRPFNIELQHWKVSVPLIYKSHVDSLLGRYLVHLYSYQTYGCNHPYFEDIYLLYKNGNYKQIKHEQIFIDAYVRRCVD